MAIGRTNAVSQGGANVDELMHDFSVATGKEVTAGKFIEFVTETIATGQAYVGSNNYYPTCVCKIDDSRIIVNSQSAKICVMTISGSTLIKGTEYTAPSVVNQLLRISDNKVLVCCSDIACVATISGSVITLGASFTVGNSKYVCDEIEPNKFIAVTAAGNSSSLTQYAKVLTINGTTITAGANLLLETAYTYSSLTPATAVCSISSTKAVCICHQSYETGEYESSPYGAIPISADRTVRAVISINGNTLTKGNFTVVESYGLTRISNERVLSFGTDFVETYSVNGTTLVQEASISLGGSYISSPCFISDNICIIQKQSYSSGQTNNFNSVLLTITDASIKTIGGMSISLGVLTTTYGQGHYYCKYGANEYIEVFSGYVRIKKITAKTAEENIHGLAKSNGIGNETVKCYYK